MHLAAKGNWVDLLRLGMQNLPVSTVTQSSFTTGASNLLGEQSLWCMIVN